MRAGGCTMQQALTSDASSVIKQAVSLAKRRGHAQVTPLHVANTMLTSSTGLLRTACLQSHSHPLQCKALELCFNVALNRLPTSTSGSMMIGTSHSQHSPSISNALVAAFKRAQAHQRRGSIENQQQPILAIKIELEQLIISILDDPSVSRVMKEAGFSSTQVKSNVEKVVVSSQSSVSGKLDSNEGVMRVMENFMNKKKRNIVIIGHELSRIEDIVKGVIWSFDEGKVHEGLRDVKVLTTFSLGHDHDIEERINELKGCNNSKGYVLYLGDLKWVVEEKNSTRVEYIIREIEKLVLENGRFWVMGIASSQTYMRCKTRYPLLESVWDLHALTIPTNKLDFSQTANSDDSEKDSMNERAKNRVLVEGEELTCCGECCPMFEREAKSLRTSKPSTLPLWLQQCQNNGQGLIQDCVSIKQICKKWNTFCNSNHHQTHKTLAFSSLSPSSSSSTCSFSYDLNFHQTHYNYPIHYPKHSSDPRITETRNNDNIIPVLTLCSSNPNSSTNSASSSDVMEMDHLNNFKEFNADNLKTLCDELARNLPSHSHKHEVREIATKVLQCRSKKNRADGKEETWLFFQGNDVESKEKIAKELGRLVFGNKFVSISSRNENHKDHRNKRSRDEQSCCIERFGEALLSNPHRVFLIEDIDKASYLSQLGFKRAIESGRVRSFDDDDDDVGVSDAIIILSCQSLRFKSSSRTCSPLIEEEEEEEDTTLDLNVSLTECDDSIVDDDDEIGLLGSVDGRFVFQLEEL